MWAIGGTKRYKESDKMAEKNILMQRKNVDGTFDVYYPKTKVGNLVEGGSGILDALKTVDGAGSGLDADAWVGLKWVKPGSDIVFDEMLDGIYLGTNVGYFYFVALRPGMYRISGEVKSNSTSYEVIVRMYKSYIFDVVIRAHLPLANEFRTSSIEYVAFNIDMNIPAMPGEIILVQVAHSHSNTQKHIKNLRLTASEGTPTIPQNSNFFYWDKIG
jgi:hypothetical protein